MTRWFILSAIGTDQPGLVAELAQLVYDCDANIEDSRMTILGTDFTVLLLCSYRTRSSAERIVIGAKRLERDHDFTILVRPLEQGARPSVPAAGHRLFRLDAAGEDRAGIVASLCRLLADLKVNITDLSSRNRPGPGGSPHYEMTMTVEVPETLDTQQLARMLEDEADRLVIDVALAPV